MKNTKKTYKLISNHLGWEFSFNADNLEQAINKAKGWCMYHSFSFKNYSVEETNDTNRMHNEWVD